MTNLQTKLIASAIIILAGGLTLSLGLIAKSTNLLYGQGGEVVGGIILTIGCILFYVNYVKSNNQD